MSEPAKLLPCPWCHAENISVEWEHCERLDSTDTNRRWFAECGKCACQGPFCQTEPEVIPAWNTRATDARIAQAEKALAELREIAEELVESSYIRIISEAREAVESFDEWKARNPE